MIGSGPNGLSAAILLARAGYAVTVHEAEETIGGGTRSAELTLPGFLHDVCSAVHPMAATSPCFEEFPLKQFGLEWIHPDAPLAHPLDDGTAIMLERSVDETCAGLGQDGPAYRKLFGPFVAKVESLFQQSLRPLRLPRNPFLMARFGLRAIRSARKLVDKWFTGERAKALFAGLAGHAILPLEKVLTSAPGLMLGVAAHAFGWPVAKGGSQKIADGLVAFLRTLGGEIRTGERVVSVDQLPPARSYLFDVAPRNLATICGERLPERYRRKLNQYRYGPAAFKVDWALDGPIPWKASDCARAATVHLGGAFDEIAAGEKAVWEGIHPERPFVLLAQQSLFDPSRAPAGKHTGWAYCHVPNGSAVDMTERIEAQVERFAPGFRQRILAKSVTTPSKFERNNANCIGGDIGGGVMDIWQAFARPVARFNPYSTPAQGIYLCSASTPPGPGVHGMCGYLAAQTTLRSVLSR